MNTRNMPSDLELVDHVLSCLVDALASWRLLAPALRLRAAVGVALPTQRPGLIHSTSAALAEAQGALKAVAAPRPRDVAAEASAIERAADTLLQWNAIARHLVLADHGAAQHGVAPYVALVERDPEVVLTSTFAVDGAHLYLGGAFDRAHRDFAAHLGSIVETEILFATAGDVRRASAPADETLEPANVVRVRLEAPLHVRIVATERAMLDSFNGDQVLPQWRVELVAGRWSVRDVDAPIRNLQDLRIPGIPVRVVPIQGEDDTPSWRVIVPPPIAAAAPSFNGSVVPSWPPLGAQTSGIER